MAKKLGFIILLVLALGLSISESGKAGEPSYPDKPITYLIQAGAGGAGDRFVRGLLSVTEKIDRKFFPVPIVVDYKPGAQGAICYTYLKNKKGDPYLLANTTQTVVATALTTGLYKVPDDFTPIARFTEEPKAIAVPGKSPYNSIDDLVKAAREKPGKIIWSGSHVGSAMHAIMILFEKSKNVKFSYLPFNDEGENIAAILGGHVGVATVNAKDVVDHHKSGMLRILGVCWETRFEKLPNTPTMIEQGCDITISTHRGVIAASDIPKKVSDWWINKFKTLSNSPQWKEHCEKEGMDIAFLGGEKFGEYLKKDINMWRELYTELGIKMAK